MTEEKNEIVEYSISPNSGRIKKKIRYRKKKSFFSSKRMKKYFEFFMLVLFFVIFIVGVVMIIRPDGSDMQRMKVIDRKGVSH